MPISLESFIQKYVKEIRNDNAAVFVGAGLSMPAGLVDWKGLLRPLADEIGLNIDKEYDLIKVAQYYLNHCRGNRGNICSALFDCFLNQGTVTPNHDILARLPIKTYWTTNYDKLLEQAFTKAGKRVDVKHNVSQLALTAPRRDVILYKMHGDIDHPNEAILTKDDYDKYHVTNHLFINALTGDLISKTFLFLGISLEDPNLDYIISRVRISLQGDTRQHFCIFKKVFQAPGERDDDFKYREIKQKLFIEDLKRSNISTVLISEYSEITTILENIERLLKSKTVFVSGAISHYQPMFPKELVESFMIKLGKALIKDGFTITSGFGLVVGNNVIYGALESIYHEEGSLDQIDIRPFPRTGLGKLHYSEHRKHLLAGCGVAIFVFGNKENDDGSVELSQGMEEEFEIARSQNIFVLPVGITGYKAEELYKKVLSDFDNINPGCRNDVKDLFIKLGATPFYEDKVVADIINILKLVNK